MRFLRPEAAAFLARWSEVAAALAVAGAGLWLVRLGGYFLTPLGLAVAAVALGWGLVALRRVRFQRPVAAPGVVEVDEGQVGYLGPSFGGYVSLRELTEIRMIRLHGERHWRLKQADGQVLLVPVAANGAGALFDAFAALPGMDTATLATAPDTSSDTLMVWRHPSRAALT